MNNSQRELRRAAAQAFMESLESLGQLEKSVKTAEDTPKGASHSVTNRGLNSGNSWFEGNDLESDLSQAWDDAAADIDQFIQAQGLDD